MNIEIINWNKNSTLFLRHTDFFVWLPEESFAVAVLHSCSFGKMGKRVPLAITFTRRGQPSRRKDINKQSSNKTKTLHDHRVS
jgi:hypothetical protein